MRNENETLQAAQSDTIRQDIDRCAAEIAQMRDSVEQANADMRRTKNDVVRHEDQHGSHVRHTRVLWAIVILLAGALAGFLWYGSPYLQEHRALLAQVPSLQSALDDVHNQVNAAGQEINAWAGERTGLMDRLSQIEKTAGANLRSVHSEARTMAQQIKVDIGQRLQSVQNRLSGVESVQRENSEEVSRLQNELAGVKGELVTLREEGQRQSSQVAQVEQAQQSTRSELSGLDRRVTSGQTKLSAIAYQTDRQRVDFELQKGHTTQVTDGIYVTVQHSNVEKQQLDGWMQIAGDGRIVWLRDKGAQQPIQFSSRSDARPYQLVFTRIEKNGAAGYILIPDNAAPGN